MAKFKHRLTGESREVDLKLEEVGRQCGGFPVPVSELNIHAALAIQSNQEFTARRLKDGNAFIEGATWDLFLTEPESKLIILEEERAKRLLEKEEGAQQSLSTMNITSHWDVTTAAQSRGFCRKGTTVSCAQLRTPRARRARARQTGSIITSGRESSSSQCARHTSSSNTPRCMEACTAPQKAVLHPSAPARLLF